MPKNKRALGLIEKKDNRRVVFTQESINEINLQLEQGYVIKRLENPWWKGKVGIKRAGVKYSMTPEEMEEYSKCYLDVNYFAENYCKIKSEDGTIKMIKLRDYQIDILNLYTQNAKSILMASRQIGKCVHSDTMLTIKLNSQIKQVYMYDLLFYINENKNVFDYLKYFLYKVRTFLRLHF